MAPPGIAHRARGALLGQAVGAALTPAGAVDPAAPGLAEVRLSRLLAEELLQPVIDIRRLALRWVEESERSLTGLEPWTRAALAHIRTHDGPPGAVGPGVGPAVVSRGVPLALRAMRSPANLVSGAYHLTTLTHPDEAAGWGAVAVCLAIATLVQGRRDFLPDVLEVLRNNAAPEPLMSALRQLPVVGKEELPPIADGPVAGTTIALWFGYHEPDLARGLTGLAADPGRAPAASAAGALMGARDGDSAIPEAWRDRLADHEVLTTLADQLTR